MDQIINDISNDTEVSKENKLISENFQIHTLCTSITIRKQIIAMIEHIEEHEFSFEISEEDNLCILRAEESFYYNDCYNFWYAVNGSGQVIGSIGMEKIDEYTAEIRKFFVEQRYRGTGVAFRLMDTLIKAASRYNIDHLYLRTLDVFQAAQNFYRKHGFSKISEQELPLAFRMSNVPYEFFKAKVYNLQSKFS